jgi:N-acetylneuraminate synthase
MFSKEINFGNYSVSEISDPFIIAEISANHNNDLDRAKQLIDEAGANGAHAVKFQTYTADTITLNSTRKEFMIDGGLWDGRSLHDLYSQGSLPWEWHEELFKHARSLGLVVISSPFDETAVDFLVELGVDALKIASFELCHIPLLEKCATSGLPIIISTGMGTFDEVSEALAVMSESGSTDVVVLHCISSYPASPDDFNLPRMALLRDNFDVLVGLSDHCIGNHVAIGSVALGATVIEKHFTLDREGGGLDDSFSILPVELNALVNNTRDLKRALRSKELLSDGELTSRSFRRSIYASRDIQNGEIFSEDNIQVVRPGLGLHPRHFKTLLGEKSKRSIAFASPINQSDL